MLLALSLPALAPGAAIAQAPTAATGTASVHGQVADPTGAVIPGATVSLTTPDGHTVSHVTTGADGSYEIKNLAPGTYIVLVVAPGFAPLDSRALTLSGSQARLFNATLKVQTAQQTVQVNADTPIVSVDPDSNANSVVIKGADLDALSDDPDELSNELTALAGPAAGPSGGQIYIDGFTAGQLPPKSAIREIRVNQNPYSAQFDKLGFGRIEILTKPGTDKYHGQFFGQGNARQFNTGNPFTKDIPDYDSYQYNGTVSGPISKIASFFVSAEHRNIQDAGIVSAYRLAGEINGDFAAGVYSNGSATAGTGDYAALPYNTGVQTPRTRTNISPRLDLQLGAKNTLVARYEYESNSDRNQGVSQFSLPSQAYRDSSSENTLQISDTTVISPKIINEVHVQLLFDRSSQSAGSATPQVQVQGNETFGGNSEQSISDHTDRYEVSTLTELALANHAINFGGRLRATREANSADSSFNGLYTFGARTCPAGIDYCPPSGELTAAQAYAITIAGQAAGQSFAQIQAAGGGPSQLVFVAGSPKADVNVIDGALYYQDDWKARPNLTLSYGLRWETQNDIHDHSDWAPRLALAYGILHNGKPTKDVIRAGFGYFYDRFGVSQVLQASRDNGIVQQERVIQNPGCYLPGGLPAASTVLTECAAGDSSSASSSSTGSSLSPAIYQISPTLHAPLNIQESLGLDHQLTKTSTVSFTYIHSHGVHALDTINANSPYSPTYDAALGNVYQYFSEAVYNQNQLFVNINARFTPRISLFGFYGLGFANSDTGGVSSNPSNSLDLKQDYGRASFDVRNRLFLIGTYQARHYFRFSPFVVANSGAPFNLTLSQDQNGDSFFNDRPSFGTAGAPNVVTNAYGSFDTAPSAGSTPIPINYGSGPALFTFNLRMSKTFGFGDRVGESNTASGGGPRGGPMGGGPPPGRGGGGGGPRGDSVSTGHRYNLTLNAQALNLFNIINVAPPTGTIDSPLFGRSNALAGQIFSSGSAARRIFLQTTFTF